MTQLYRAHHIVTVWESPRQSVCGRRPEGCSMLTAAGSLKGLSGTPLWPPEVMALVQITQSDPTPLGSAWFRQVYVMCLDQ